MMFDVKELEASEAVESGVENVVASGFAAISRETRRLRGRTRFSLKKKTSELNETLKTAHDLPGKESCCLVFKTSSC